MNHRKFVITSTVSLLVVAAVVAGLAFYSNFAVKASIPDLPAALSYLPVKSQVVFGMNVPKFVSSPIFAKFQQQHGQEFGSDLQAFITATGVDPANDLYYVVAAARADEARKGSGVALAIAKPGRVFDTNKISAFIQSKTKAVPVQLTYQKALVLMVPEADGSKLEKGVAFLSSTEMALGDLDSVKAVLDARADPSLGIEANPTLLALIQSLDTRQMFWFAGDAASILSKAPTNTPFGGSIASIQNVVGTLNLDDSVAGKVTATAKDADAAQKLLDVVRGFKALGQLAAGNENQQLNALLNGVNFALEQDPNTKAMTRVSLVINFSYDLLDQLKTMKPVPRKI